MRYYLVDTAAAAKFTKTATALFKTAFPKNELSIVTSDDGKKRLFKVPGPLILDPAILQVFDSPAPVLTLFQNGEWDKLRQKEPPAA